MSYGGAVPPGTQQNVVWAQPVPGANPMFPGMPTIYPYMVGNPAQDDYGSQMEALYKKNLTYAPKFSGKPEDWTTFSWKFLAWARVFQVDELLEQASAEDDAQWSQEL